MSKKSSYDKSLIVPDPAKKTYIDEQGRKYWFTSGYYGRAIKMYGEPWKFRTTLWEVVAQIVFFGLVAFVIYSAIFGK